MYAPTEVIDQKWFLQEDNQIGGWAITTVDAPPTDNKGFVITTISNKAIAQNIVDRHNDWHNWLVFNKQSLHLLDKISKGFEEITKGLNELAKPTI